MTEKLGIEINSVGIVNLTPHELTIIVNESGDYIKLAPSGTIARVGMKREYVGITHNIPIHHNTYSEIVGLPNPQKDTIYIVSKAVKDHCHNRTDVYYPGELIRDDQGRPIACKGLSI